MPIADRLTAGAVVPSESRAAINYILGGPFDDQYQSKRQQKKLLRATTVKARGAGRSWQRIIFVAATQMKLSSRILNSTRRILSGFNGAKTTTLGDITLPIQVGPVTQ